MPLSNVSRFVPFVCFVTRDKRNPQSSVTDKSDKTSEPKSLSYNPLIVL